MKKILAIAVVSAIAAPAMADMTIGGSIDFRYRALDTYTSATVDGKDAGFGLDNAQLNIKASETLENGITVAAAFDVDNLMREGAASGNDATLTLSGDFGSLKMGVVESGNGIIGLGGAGAPAEVLDGTVIAGASNRDIVAYTAPAMGAITLSALHVGGASLESVGTGISGATAFGASLSAGVVTAKADYTMSDNKGATEFNRVRVSGKADLGAVSIGAGYETVDYAAEYTTKTDYVDTIVGVAMPMGDVTLGATMMNHDDDATGADRKGWSVGASYAIAPSLTASVKHASWKDEAERSNESQTQTTASLKYAF
jgi:predicted porin